MGVWWHAGGLCRAGAGGLVGLSTTETRTLEGVAVPGAEKVSVTLTAEMVQAIRAGVDSGEYVSASEVVRDALRRWQLQRAEEAERLDAVRARIRRSIDDPRPSLSGSEVDVELAAFFEELAPSGGDAAA